MKTFYLETFGCQMNAHDSEKVVGTLLEKGYEQVKTPADAGLVLYNTCSIRDKAEQKVFNKLDQFKKINRGKKIAVLGCVAQQEGEKIFERAPHVDMVCGSASYPKFGQLLVQLENGDNRVTGLSLDTDETFDTPFTRRDNPHRAYLTIIEGCDKACAYCVVPMTRGPERSRTSESVLRESRDLAAAGYTDIQLLGQNVNSYRDPSGAAMNFAQLLNAVGRVEGIKRVRFTTSHPRDFDKDIIDALDENPVLCNHVHLPVQSGSDSVLQRMQRLYTRSQYMQRVEWMKRSPRNIAITTDIIVGFCGETEAEFEETMSLVKEVEYESMFSFKYSPRPNTPALKLDNHVPEEEKQARLVRLQALQREIQERCNAPLLGTVEEVMVEGFNKATEQWIGRTSQNRTLNFTLPDGVAAPVVGGYRRARVTKAGPHSLAGVSELVGEMLA
jgi:tRNA-2-methylthio-N6-dimethylallyladenosine synthase